MVVATTFCIVVGVLVDDDFGAFSVVFTFNFGAVLPQFGFL